MHVAGVHLLVEDPRIRRARIEQRPYLLRGLVAHVDVCHVREVHVVVQVQSQAATSLLRILVQLALIHVLFLFVFLTILLTICLALY